jgi:flagellar basal-body rod protein FlgB
MFGDQRLQLMARLMDVSVLKAQVHAANLANQNTPGYRARTVAFDDAFQAALAQDGEDGDSAAAVEPSIVEARATPVQADGNDVAVTNEIMDSAKNQTMYDAYIAMTKGKLRLLNLAAGAAPGG